MTPLFVGPAIRFAYRKAGRLPLARSVLQWDYSRRFARNVSTNLFRGVFRTFEEATQSAPANRPLGYDHAEAGEMYRERTERVYLNDYPLLFWLGRLLPHARRVFDFGGHVGVAYYAYARYLGFPPDLRWTVCDVPAVAEAGRRLAEEKGAAGLTFTTRPEDAAGADIYFASGALQYVETPLSVALEQLVHRPRHLLLNLLPLHPTHSFVTLQSITTAYCPNLVQQRGAFLDSLRALGYRLVDSWENPDRACELYFQPEYSVRGYSGLYLTQDPA